MEKMATTASGLRLRSESAVKETPSQTPEVNRLSEGDLLLCGGCRKCNSVIQESSPSRFCPLYPVPLFVIDPLFRRIYCKLNRLGIETCFCCAGVGRTACLDNVRVDTDVLHPQLRRCGRVSYVEGPEHHPGDLPMALVVLSERSTELCRRLRKIHLTCIGNKSRQLFRAHKAPSITGRIRNDGEFDSEYSDCYYIGINARLIGLSPDIGIAEHHAMPNYLWAIHAKMREKWLEKLEEMLDNMAHEKTASLQSSQERVHAR